MMMTTTKTKHMTMENPNFRKEGNYSQAENGRSEDEQGEDVLQMKKKNKRKRKNKGYASPSFSYYVPSTSIRPSSNSSVENYLSLSAPSSRCIGDGESAPHSRDAEIRTPTLLVESSKSMEIPRNPEFRHHLDKTDKTDKTDRKDAAALLNAAFEPARRQMMQLKRKVWHMIHHHTLLKDSGSDGRTGGQQSHRGQSIK
jgi:hypothetical protein